jgi:hypothetical protein
MKYLAVFTLFLFFSCSNKDTKICSCLDAGEKLNQFSSEMLIKEASKEDVVKMKALKDEKSKKCADYQTMNGDEMLKLKANCQEK